MSQRRPQRLYREPEEKKLAGVCGGMADYFGLDPTVVRLAAVVIAVATGFTGVVAYIVAAVVIPLRPQTEPRLQSPPPDWQLSRGRNTAVLIGLLIVALLLMAGGGWWWWADAPVIGAVLVAIGVWLLISRDQQPATPGPAAPDLPVDRPTGHPMDVPVDAPMDRPTADIATTSTTWSDSSTTLAGEAASASPRGETPPPIAPWGFALSARVLALLLIVAGAVAFLVVFDFWEADVQEALGIGLLVVGAGMVVGAWRGRALGLLALGLPILALLIVADLVDLPLEGDLADRRVDVGTVAELRRLDPTQKLLAGQLVLDLTEAPLGSAGVEGTDLAVDVGVGNVQVLLPESVRAVVDAEVGAGSIRIDDREESGVDLDRTEVIQGDPGGGRIDLDLHVGMGEVEVTHG